MGAYAPSGVHLAVGYLDGHVQLLESDSLSLVHGVQHPVGAWCMAYAPSGVHLAVGYYDGHVQLLEGDSLSLVHDVQHSAERAQCIAFVDEGILNGSPAHQHVK